MRIKQIHWALKLFIIFFVLVVLDQITKMIVHHNFYLGESIPIIDGLFNLTYVRNQGAAFGFMAQAESSIRTFLFLLIPILACVWLLFLIWQTKDSNKVLTMAYTLILTGAIGNLIDRVRFGYVVDFLDFYFKGAHFPAFNIADSCITIAAILLIWDFFFQLYLSKKNS